MSEKPNMNRDVLEGVVGWRTYISPPSPVSEVPKGTPKTHREVWGDEIADEYIAKRRAAGIPDPPKGTWTARVDFRTPTQEGKET